MGDFFAEHKGSFVALAGVIASLVATKIGLEQQLVANLLMAIAAIVVAYVGTHNAQKAMANKADAMVAIADAGKTSPANPS